jgi:predicted  nucleic acid-binding Zn-ribbon protein
MSTTSSMSNEEKLRAQVRQIRALVQAGRQRIAALRPVWGAYLAGETMNSLEHAVDELERELGLAESEKQRSASGVPGVG